MEVEKGKISNKKKQNKTNTKSPAARFLHNKNILEKKQQKATTKKNMQNQNKNLPPIFPISQFPTKKSNHKKKGRRTSNQKQSKKNKQNKHKKKKHATDNPPPPNSKTRKRRSRIEG